ncbi:MAG: hypothetical protein JO154_09695 [Chitinophaga sp.]|nr:hypothetical protein [Chitinophaga sp.]
MLMYLLKANVALTLCFLAYRLGLRRLTFYTLNRIFLLIGIVVAAIFPLIDINPFVAKHDQITQVLVYMPDWQQLRQAPTFNYWNLLVYAFWAGVAVMAIRLVIQLASMWRIHKTAVDDQIDGQQVKVLSSSVNPFSFFQNIYINPALHQPEELQDILRHEQVHVRQWHSLDVLLGEINNIFYWFNPGAWLMKSAIRENLEFITDRYLLRQGVDKKNYQYNLLKISGIPYATAIANNFNFSHLKNRIMMMNKRQSSTFQVVRYLVLGAMVGGIVLSLNYSKAASSARGLLPFMKKDTTTKLITGHPAEVIIVSKSGEPVTLTADTISLVDTGKEKLIIKSADKVKIISKNTNGNQIFIANSNTQSFTAKSSQDTTIQLSSVVFTNEHGNIKQVTTEDKVVNDEKGGKVVVGMKSESLTLGGPQSPKDTVRLTLSAKPSKSNTDVSKCLIMINGVQATWDEAKALDANEIESMQVLKDASATSRYGTKGENGVILITTKRESQKQ